MGSSGADHPLKVDSDLKRATTVAERLSPKRATSVAPKRDQNSHKVWVRDLTREGIEPNPGPFSSLSSDESCCMLSASADCTVCGTSHVACACAFDVDSLLTCRYCSTSVVNTYDWERLLGDGEAVRQYTTTFCARVMNERRELENLYEQRIAHLVVLRSYGPLGFGGANLLKSEEATRHIIESTALHQLDCASIVYGDPKLSTWAMEGALSEQLDSRLNVDTFFDDGDTYVPLVGNTIPWRPTPALSPNLVSLDYEDSECTAAESCGMPVDLTAHFGPNKGDDDFLRVYPGGLLGELEDDATESAPFAEQYGILSVSPGPGNHIFKPLTYGGVDLDNYFEPGDAIVTDFLSIKSGRVSILFPGTNTLTHTPLPNLLSHISIEVSAKGGMPLAFLVGRIGSEVEVRYLSCFRYEDLGFQYYASKTAYRGDTLIQALVRYLIGYYTSNKMALHMTFKLKESHRVCGLDNLFKRVGERVFGHYVSYGQRIRQFLDIMIGNFGWVRNLLGENIHPNPGPQRGRSRGRGRGASGGRGRGRGVDSATVQATGAHVEHATRRFKFTQCDVSHFIEEFDKHKGKWAPPMEMEQDQLETSDGGLDKVVRLLFKTKGKFRLPLGPGDKPCSFSYFNVLTGKEVVYFAASDFLGDGDVVEEQQPIVVTPPAACPPPPVQPSVRQPDEVQGAVADRAFNLLRERAEKERLDDLWLLAQITKASRQRQVVLNDLPAESDKLISRIIADEANECVSFPAKAFALNQVNLRFQLLNSKDRKTFKSLIPSLLQAYETAYTDGNTIQLTRFSKVVDLGDLHVIKEGTYEMEKSPLIDFQAAAHAACHYGTKVAEAIASHAKTLTTMAEKAGKCLKNAYHVALTKYEKQFLQLGTQEVGTPYEALLHPDMFDAGDDPSIYDIEEYYDAWAAQSGRQGDVVEVPDAEAPPEPTYCASTVPTARSKYFRIVPVTPPDEDLAPNDSAPIIEAELPKVASKPKEPYIGKPIYARAAQLKAIKGGQIIATTKSKVVFVPWAPAATTIMPTVLYVPVDCSDLRPEHYGFLAFINLKLNLPKYSAARDKASCYFEKAIRRARLAQSVAFGVPVALLAALPVVFKIVSPAVDILPSELSTMIFVDAMRRCNQGTGVGVPNSKVPYLCRVFLPNVPNERHGHVVRKRPVLVKNDDGVTFKVKYTEDISMAVHKEGVVQQDGIFYTNGTRLFARQSAHLGRTHFTYRQLSNQHMHFEVNCSLSESRAMMTLDINRADTYYQSSLLGVHNLFGFLSLLPWWGKSFQWNDLIMDRQERGLPCPADSGCIDFNAIDLARPEHAGYNPATPGIFQFPEKPIPIKVLSAVTSSGIGIATSTTRTQTAVKRCLQELITEDIIVENPASAAYAVHALSEVQTLRAKQSFEQLMNFTGLQSLYNTAAS